MKSASLIKYLIEWLLGKATAHSRKQKRKSVKLTVRGVFFDAGLAAWETSQNPEEVTPDVDWN